jgi:hypothetical protein
VQFFNQNINKQKVFFFFILFQLIVAQPTACLQREPAVLVTLRLKWNSDFFDLHSFNHLYGWCCLLFSQIKPTHYLEWLFRQGILDYLLFDFFWPAKIFSVGVYILTDRSAIRVVDKILTQIICFSVHLI